MLWGKMWRELCKLNFLPTLNQILGNLKVFVWFETAKATSWWVPFPRLVTIDGLLKYKKDIKTVFWFVLFSQSVLLHLQVLHLMYNEKHKRINTISESQEN